MSRRKKIVDHSDARNKAVQRYGTDAMLFVDLEVGASFYFASEHPNSTYVKLGKRRYRYDGRVCYAQARQPVKAIQVQD